MEPILLDEQIRASVLLPIFLIVLLMMMIRQNMTSLLHSEPKVDLENLRSNSLLNRAKLFKANGNYLTERAFKIRKAFFVKKDTGALWKAPAPLDPMEMMAKQTEASQALGMLKGQMSFVFLQGGSAYLINYLFSGFLVAKAPFPLSFRFKSMLQRGVDVASLDVTYVSSLSWYFFIMLSSNGFLGILNHLRGKGLDNAAQEQSSGDSSNSMALAAMGMPPNAGMPMPAMNAPDYSKLFAQQREALEFHRYTGILANAEESCLRTLIHETKVSGRL